MLLFATNQIAATRRLTQDGVDYLIAPVVAIRAGELNGEIVTLEEISAHFHQWNGTPFVVGHPEINGVSVSANDPETLATMQIGQLFNVEMDDDKLKGEIWVNLAQAAKVTRGAEVVNRLENGQLEVSTAYFRDRVNGTARNIRNDHLAALLDENGACSWDDGCGAPRINAKDKKMDNDKALPILERIELGLNKWFKVNQDKEENRMGELIEQLLAAEGMTLNAEQLGAMSEDALVALGAMLIKVVEDVAEVVPEPAANDDAPEPTTPEPAANAQPCAQTDILMALAEAIEKRGGLDAFLTEPDRARQQSADAHTALVTQLVANAQCVMTQEELAPLPMDTLQSLARSFLPTDYSGQAAGAPVSTADIEYVM